MNKKKNEKYDKRGISSHFINVFIKVAYEMIWFAVMALIAGMLIAADDYIKSGKDDWAFPLWFYYCYFFLLFTLSIFRLSCELINPPEYKVFKGSVIEQIRTYWIEIGRDDYSLFLEDCKKTFIYPMIIGIGILLTSVPLKLLSNIFSSVYGNTPLFITFVLLLHHLLLISIFLGLLIYSVLDTYHTCGPQLMTSFYRMFKRMLRR